MCSCRRRPGNAASYARVDEANSRVEQQSQNMGGRESRGEDGVFVGDSAWQRVLAQDLGRCCGRKVKLKSGRAAACKLANPGEN